MGLLLLIGIVLFTYVGAILVLLYKKEDYKKALAPGTLAWIIVLVVSFFIVFETLNALVFALVAGIIAQLLMPELK